MAGESVTVAEDDDFHAGTGDGYVHAAQVAEEAYLAFVVGADEGDEDDVALLTLEAIDGVDADEGAVGLEEVAALEAVAQVLHLGAVG